MKKSVRSQSGVCVISVATDGFNNITCEFDCSFCPSECVKNGAKLDISRSYLSTEGTFKRGLVDNFNTKKQVWRRIAELEAMNHYPDKFEIIILGGTWDCMPRVYRTTLIHNLFYACNTYPQISTMLKGEFSHLMEEWLATEPFKNNLGFDPEEKIEKVLRPMKTLEEEKEINENLSYSRIIGIVLETRPDQISKYNTLYLRKLGCTRVQLGIQQTDNDILALNKRGHGVEASIKALKILKENCFKVDGHMMPDLPFTTLEKDYKMADDIFLSTDFQLDYVKIYPCLRLPYTKAAEWYDAGIWCPIAETNFEGFLQYLEYCLSIVPPWTRVNRVQRDFPVANEKNEGLGFISPTIKTNLHQMITDRMKKHGLKCYDIRSREIKNEVMDLNKAELYIRKYEANGGTEYFISFEIPKSERDWDDAYLLGLLRLRLSDDTDSSYLLKTFQEKVAKIREVHVYGFVSGNKENNVVQHRGIGKALLKVAETIALSEGYKKIAVISGVGVRKYYKNQGYSNDSIDGEYLVKELMAYNRKIYLFNFEYDYENIIYKTSLRGDKEYKAGNGKLYIVGKNDNLFQARFFVGILCVMLLYLVFIIGFNNY